MKKCPYCSENIQEDAIKCRYCGEWLPHNEAEAINQNEYVYRSRDALSYSDTRANKDTIVELYSQGKMRSLDEIWDPETKSWCYVKDCSLFRGLPTISSAPTMSICSGGKKTSNALIYIAGLAAAVISAAMVRYLGPAVLLLIISFIAGIFFPPLFFNKSKNMTVINIIAYSNLVIWLIPFLGLFTSIATLGSVKYVERQRGLYAVLGLVGFLSSMGLFMVALIAR